MRRVLAFLLAGLAVGVSLAFVAQGLFCGAKRVAEECFSPEDCAAKAECVRYVHPYAPVLVAASLAGVGAVSARRPGLALGLGVPVLGFGILSAFSLGFMGIALGLLLVGVGTVAGAEKGLLVAAWVAVAASGAYAVALFTVQLPLALVYGGAALPTVGYLVFAGTRARKNAN